MADSFNNWSKIAAQVPGLTSQMVRKTAMDAKANIQSNIRNNDQVDTGFMLGSVYVVTSEGSDYQGGEKALPEVAGPPDDQTAMVAVGASYAIFQELGTSRMTGRAFFAPGMDEARSSMDAAMKLIADKLGNT